MLIASASIHSAGNTQFVIAAIMIITWAGKTKTRLRMPSEPQVVRGCKFSINDFTSVVVIPGVMHPRVIPFADYDTLVY